MKTIFIRQAKYLHDYCLAVQFTTGETSEVDLSAFLEQEGVGVFAPLKNKDFFKSFQFNPNTQTIEWDNGADIAPEYLYFLAYQNKYELQGKFKQWGYLAA